MSIESMNNKAMMTYGDRVGSKPAKHGDVEKHLVMLVLRENGSNNWQEWVEAWKMVGPLLYPKDDQYKAITEAVQWVDPRWVVLRQRIPDDHPDVKQLIYRDDRDSMLQSTNTMMLNSLLLSVDKALILKAKSQNSEEFQQAIDNHRPDLIRQIFQKTVLLRHVDGRNNRLAAEERLHSIRTRTRDPASHAKLYKEFANVYLDTLTPEKKVEWLADPTESNRYVKTLGPEFHLWLTEMEEPPLRDAGLEAVISASLLWYRKEQDKRLVSGLKAPGLRVSDRNVAFIAESDNPRPRLPFYKFKGKLNNGGANGRDGSSYTQYSKSASSAHPHTQSAVTPVLVQKSFAAGGAGRGATYTRSFSGRGGHGNFGGRGGASRGRGGRTQGRGRGGSSSQQPGTAKFAHSDGLAYRLRPFDIDDDMPELVDDDLSSDSSFVEPNATPRASAPILSNSVRQDVVSPAYRALHHELGAMFAGSLFTLSRDPVVQNEDWEEVSVSSAANSDVDVSHANRVCDAEGNAVPYQFHVGPISIHGLKGGVTDDAMFVIEGLKDLIMVHSESYMLSELRSFLEHRGYPRRLSYDPSIVPDFVVDVKDEASESIGSAFMLRDSDEDEDSVLYCCDCYYDSPHRYVAEVGSIRCSQHNDELTIRQAPVPLPPCRIASSYSKPAKKRRGELDGLTGDTLGPTADPWACSKCDEINPYDYEYCMRADCLQKRCKKRVAKPSGAGSLAEKSIMHPAFKYVPPVNSNKSTEKPSAGIATSPLSVSSTSESGNRDDSGSPMEQEVSVDREREDELLARGLMHIDEIEETLFPGVRYVRQEERFLVSKKRYDHPRGDKPDPLPLTIVGRDKIVESLDALLVAVAHHKTECFDLDQPFFDRIKSGYDDMMNFLVSYEYRKNVENGSYQNLGQAFSTAQAVAKVERSWANDYLHRYQPQVDPFVRHEVGKSNGPHDVKFCSINSKFVQCSEPPIDASGAEVAVESIVLNRPLCILESRHGRDYRHVEHTYGDYAIRETRQYSMLCVDKDDFAVKPPVKAEIHDDELVYMAKSGQRFTQKKTRKGYGDSAASHNIGSLLDKHLYSNIRKLTVPKRFNGVGQGSIVCYVIGDRGGVKDVYLSEDIDESLFSFASLWEQGFRGEINNENQTLTFLKEESIVVFKLTDRMLLLTELDGASIDEGSGSALMTDELPPSRFSKRQKQRADAYWAWHKGCGHHGHGVETQLLQATPLHHCEVTAQDKVIALDISGPCAACVAGKATSPKSLPIVLQRKYLVGECQYVDIMLVRLSSGQHRIKFIFVDSNCLKVVLVHATSKSTSEYSSALSKVSGYYKSRGFNEVRITYSDNEPAIHGYEEEFLKRGGQTRFVAAGEHVVIVERSISTIKKMCRTLLLSLVYPLPERLINYLLDEVVSLMSLRPTEGTNGLPLIVFLEGRWPDFRRLSVEWGAYVYATIPVDRRRHDFAATAEPAILLRRPLCGEPNFTCMLLKNNELVQRRCIKAMIMPETIIAEFKATTSVTPTLSFMDQPIRGDLLRHDIEVVTPRGAEIGRGQEVVSMLEAEEEIRDQVDAQFREDVGHTIVDLTNSSDSDSLLEPIVIKDEEPPTQEPELAEIPVAVANPTRATANRRPTAAERDRLARQNVQRVISEVSQLQSGQAKIAHEISKREYEALRITQRRECKAIGVALRRRFAINREARSFRDAVVGSLLATADVDLRTEPHTSKFSKPAKSGNMSFKSAKGKHDSVAEDAGLKEVAQILEKDIFEPVFWNDLSQAMKDKAIRSFTFFKEKFQVSGALDKLKARLVAGGNLVASEELGDISAPTAKLETLFLLHALAAQFGWMISVMDVPGAYLNTVLPEAERIPMILGKEEAAVVVRLKPDWKKYVRHDGTMAVMLKGGLYGMPQAAKLWNQMIASTLSEQGYVQAEADTCLFIKFYPNGKKSIVLLYVDDLAHFHEEKSMQESLIKALSQRYGDLTADHGDNGIYIGVEYNYDRVNKSVKLTMSKYVNKLLKDFNVQKGASTPVAADFMDRDESSPKVDSKVFASGVMSLYYLALRVRKDLLFVVTVLSTRIQDCRQDDVDKMARVYSFLYTTRHQGVILRTRGVDLVFSIDASYATHSNARSHTGFYVTLGDGGPPPDGYGGPIHCRSVVQKLVTLSSFEAELNAIHQSVQYFYDLRSLMSELGFDQDKPSILLQDNQATIQVVTKGPSVQSRSRHVNVRIFNVKQMVDWGMLLVVYQSTELMLADALTKPFSSRASLGALTRLLNWY